MADRYWVGGSNTWNNTAGSKWATTSGGVGGAAVPTSSDDVYFDGIATGGGSAGAINISMGQSAFCRNFNTTGFAGTWSNTASLTVSGSWVTTTGWTNSYTGNVTFNATSGVQAITAGGQSFGSNFTFNGVGGTWQLQDDFLTASGKTVSLLSGELQLNTHTLTTGFFSSNIVSTRVLDMTNSTMVLTGAGGNLWNTNVATLMTLNASGSLLQFANTSGSNASMLLGGGLNWEDIEYAGSGGASLTLSSSNFQLLANNVIFTQDALLKINTKYKLGLGFKMPGPRTIQYGTGGPAAFIVNKRYTNSGNNWVNLN